MNAFVTGATGFVGREVVKALRARGMEVRCLLHAPGRDRVLEGQQVDVHYGSVQDPETLKAAFYNVDVAVHLVAIIRESHNATFEGVIRQGTENLVAMARSEGVKQFIYVSAIGTIDDPDYPYLYNKWRAEQALIGSGLPYTILRPSILFGEGDEFINTMAGMVRSFPIIPIAGSGSATFQPLAVDELARCVAAAAGREDLMEKVIEIGGPDYLSYDDMVDIIAHTYGVRRRKLHIPLAFMRPAVRAMEALLPRPPATTHQLAMLSIPNVAELDTVERVFGFKPRPLRGNIEFIKRISIWDGLRIASGFFPTRIRDH